LGAQDRLDEAITKAAEHWTIDRMVSIDRCILRLAAYELLDHPETPPSVVINEAIEIAQDYSADDAGRFVNGVLDRIRKNAAGLSKPKTRRKKSDGDKNGS
jgi:N utilization substance protein B